MQLVVRVFRLMIKETSKKHRSICFSGSTLGVPRPHHGREASLSDVSVWRIAEEHSMLDGRLLFRLEEERRRRRRSMSGCVLLFYFPGKSGEKNMVILLYYFGQ